MGLNQHVGMTNSTSPNPEKLALDRRAAFRRRRRCSIATARFTPRAVSLALDVTGQTPEGVDGRQDRRHNWLATGGTVDRLAKADDFPRGRRHAGAVSHQRTRPDAVYRCARRPAIASLLGEWPAATWPVGLESQQGQSYRRATALVGADARMCTAVPLTREAFRRHDRWKGQLRMEVRPHQFTIRQLLIVTIYCALVLCLLRGTTGVRGLLRISGG